MRRQFSYDLRDLFLQVWKTPEVQIMMQRDAFANPDSVAYVMEIIANVIEEKLDGVEKDRLILLSHASEFMSVINQTHYIMSVLQRNKSNLLKTSYSFNKTVQMYPTHLVDPVITLFKEWSEETGIEIDIYLFPPEKPSQQSRLIIIGTGSGDQSEGT